MDYDGHCKGKPRNLGAPWAPLRQTEFYEAWTTNLKPCHAIKINKFQTSADEGLGEKKRLDIAKQATV